MTSVCLNLKQKSLQSFRAWATGGMMLTLLVFFGIVGNDGVVINTLGNDVQLMLLVMVFM